MIKNVIFDLGNVLLRFDPQGYLRTKVNDENKVQELYNEIFLSQEWPMLDRGTISEKDAIDQIVKRSLQNAELIRHCMANWYEILVPMEDNINVLKEIKNSGYKTFILSNFHSLAYENVTNRYDFFAAFDGGIISYREKLLKPEKEIYHTLTQRYNIAPSESIFVDDTQVNIEGARMLGFETILFNNVTSLREEFVKKGILKS